jgi:hypothetical protein
VKVIFLWRIQKRGEPQTGCFRTSDGPAARAAQHGFSFIRFPEPREEGHSLAVGQEYCAFSSKAQLHGCFTTPAQREAALLHEDYELVRLECVEAVLLNRQAVFRWEHVISIHPKNPREFI